MNSSNKQTKELKSQGIRRVIAIKHGDKLFVTVAFLLCVEIGMFSHLYSTIFSFNSSPPDHQRNVSVKSSGQEHSYIRSSNLVIRVEDKKSLSGIEEVSSKSEKIPNSEDKKNPSGKESERILSSSHNDKPRVVFLELPESLPRRSRSVDPLGDTGCCSKDPLHYIKVDEKPFYEECRPMTEWQTKFYPTCNIMHELPLVESEDSKRNANSNANETAAHDAGGEASVSLINTQGSWRSVWKVTQRYQKDGDTEQPQQIVLKTLRYNREFNHESFHLQYSDSMAMERLTSSPYIANEYGFCGQSVLTEYARRSGRDLIKNKKLKTWQRVQIAHDLAAALSDMHSIDYPNATNATLTHNDINIANTIQGEDGRIKFNDFNIAVIMRWNQTKPCGSPVHFSAPLWRSPEEIAATNTTIYVQPEKSDTYALGNLLFQVLTTHQPWTWLEPGGRLSVEEVIKKKLEGELPYIPSKFLTNKTGTLAMYFATLACYEYDPDDRPTSFQLADALRKALKWTKNGVAKRAEEVKQLFDFRKQRKEETSTRPTIKAAKVLPNSNLSLPINKQTTTSSEHKRNYTNVHEHMSKKTKALLQARKNQVREAERNKAVIERRRASRPKSRIASLLTLPTRRRNQTLVLVTENTQRPVANRTQEDLPF